jgi:hypothetical protein
MVSKNLEQLSLMIHLFRGQQVMLDSDLATLYGVKTHVLNQAVKRKKKNFPDDFMFRLTDEEHESLISQSVISKKGRGGRRTNPYVFTEHGILMLSSVLSSDRAVQTNITIMRLFKKMKDHFTFESGLREKIGKLEGVTNKHDGQIQSIILVVDQLVRNQNNDGNEIKIPVPSTDIPLD